MSTIIMVGLVILGAVLLFNIIGGLVNLLISMVAWAIAGAIASRIMNNESNILESVLLGLVGGFVGSLLLGLLGLREALGDIWLIGGILVGIVGAVVVIFIGRQLGIGMVGEGKAKRG